jgi:hypothetical protein
VLAIISLHLIVAVAAKSYDAIDCTVLSKLAPPVWDLSSFSDSTYLFRSPTLLIYEAIEYTPVRGLSSHVIQELAINAAPW